MDKIVDGMDFGELCNEFECISSPSVEATARQLARDILELRQGNRALGTYAVSVQYKVFTVLSVALFVLSATLACAISPLCLLVHISFPSLFVSRGFNNRSNSKIQFQDPVRSFTGREKYKRPLWVTDALEKPTVVRILF